MIERDEYGDDIGLWLTYCTVGHDDGCNLILLHPFLDGRHMK